MGTGLSDVALPSPAIETNRGRSVRRQRRHRPEPVDDQRDARLVEPPAARRHVSGSREDATRCARGVLGRHFPRVEPLRSGVIGAWGGNVGNLWSPNVDLYAYNDALQFSDKLTRLAGDHALKFGASIERLQKQLIFPNQAEGMFTFDPSFTPGSTGNTVGDILTGRVAAYHQGTRSRDGRFRMWNVDAFAQDSWKLRPNLTLEYGVRGGYWTNNAELNGLGGWFDPARYDPTRPAVARRVVPATERRVLRVERLRRPGHLRQPPALRYATRQCGMGHRRQRYQRAARWLRRLLQSPTGIRRIQRHHGDAPRVLFRRAGCLWRVRIRRRSWTHLRHRQGDYACLTAKQGRSGRSRPARLPFRRSRASASRTRAGSSSARSSRRRMSARGAGGSSAE